MRISSGLAAKARKWFPALVLLSVVIRILMLPNTDLSPDYNFYYKAWVEAYREQGVLEGLSHTIGDYYTPLNVMYALTSLVPCAPWLVLGIVSMVFEYVGLYFIYRILMLFVPESEDRDGICKFAVLICLYLPHSLFNAALWKQCDDIYLCFAFIALYFLFREKYAPAFLFLGMSLSVKLQAVFFIPFFFTVYVVKRKFSILQFGWLPAVYLAAGLPAVLCKHGLRATYFTYLLQTGEGDTEGYGMTAYFPNFYQLGLDDYYDLLHLPAVLLTGAVLLFTIWFIRKHREAFTGERMLYAAIIQIWTCLMFLPSMHERYDYGLVLLLTGYIAALRIRNRKIAAGIFICNVICLTVVLFHQKWLIPALYPTAVVYIACYLYSFRDFMNMMKVNEEGA